MSLHFAGRKQSFSAFKGFSGNIILVSHSLNSESLATHSRKFPGTWENMGEVDMNLLTADELRYVAEINE